MRGVIFPRQTPWFECTQEEVAWKRRKGPSVPRSEKRTDRKCLGLRIEGHLLQLSLSHGRSLCSIGESGSVLGVDVD